MKCLTLTSKTGTWCIPISRIDSVAVELMDCRDGIERWVVYVAYSGNSDWHEYFDTKQEAMARYAELANVLMSY